MSSGPELGTVLETLEKLTSATDEYVKEQSVENEATLKDAMDKYRRSLSEAKDRKRFAVIALAEREFDAATPEGKLVIAKKLQEDMGDLGLHGAVACAIAGVSGTATKIHRSLVDAAESRRSVKEEAAPRRRNEPVSSTTDAETAPDADVKAPAKEAAAEGGSVAPAEAGGADDPDASAKSQDDNGIKGAISKTIAGVTDTVTHTATKLHKAWVEREGEKKVKEEEGPKRREAPPSAHAGADEAREAGDKSEASADEPGAKGNKVGEALGAVTEQFGRLMNKLASHPSGEAEKDGKAGEPSKVKEAAKADGAGKEKADETSKDGATDA